MIMCDVSEKFHDPWLHIAKKRETIWSKLRSIIDQWFKNHPVYIKKIVNLGPQMADINVNNQGANSNTGPYMGSPLKSKLKKRIFCMLEMTKK